MTNQAPQASTGRWATFLAKRWLSIILVALTVVFVAQNQQAVSFSLLWATFSAPLWIVLAAVLAIGLLAGALRVRSKHKAAARGRR